MALVNPNIAMSFRQPEFRPRNALAEYAQIQQIMGGQRQAEVADMQMESLRRERDALGQIQAAIVAKGGPPDLDAAADAMIRTGRPEYLTQGMAIRTALRNQRDAEAYRRDFGGGAAAPSAAAAAPANAIAAPAAAPAGELVAAPIAPLTGTVRNIAPGGAVGPEVALSSAPAARQRSGPAKEIFDEYGEEAARFFEDKGYFVPSMFTPLAAQRREDPEVTARMAVFDDSIKKIREAEAASSARFRAAAGLPPLTAAAPAGTANALAPAAAAPVTNAMVAPAAQPAVPPAGVQLASAGAAAPDANAARLRALEAQYRRIGNNPELASEKALVLKQIEAALQAQGKTATPQIKEIGVATKTNEPVYFDARTDEQFTIATDATGKQVRKPYTGGVNRATSSVTATATSSTPTAKSLAAEVGQRANTSLVKAEGAAGIMENANMVREALNTGNVIAGPLAGVRTKFAQVLELAGAGDKEKLVNTRSAIQGLASLTLESRAELKGQGQITDTETKLLERARSAEIGELTIAELQQVVNVSQRLANRMWSSHQNLLKTMEGDPAAADSIRYYRPSMSLPQAIGEGRPQGDADKRTQGLDKIFKPQPR